MRERIARLAAAAGMVALLLGPASAAPAAPPSIAACDMLKSAAQSAKEQRGSRAMEYLRAFFSFTDAPAQPAKTEPEFPFTIKSSFSVQPVCSEGRTERADHLYYMIGLVVRKLGEIDLDGKLLLVETEYGLKTFIPTANLASLRNDRVYFFANLPDGKPYCTRQTEEVCRTNELDARRRLDPQTRYGIADRAQFDRRYPEKRNHIVARGKPCGLIHVGIYGTAVDEKGEPAMQERGQFDTCEDPAASTRTVKIVKFDDYRDYFSKSIDGALLRADTGVLTKIAPEFARNKTCNTAVTFDSSIEGQIKGGGKLNLVALEFSAETAKKYGQRFKEEVGLDVAIEYLAYYLAASRQDAKADALPIQIRYKCAPPNKAPIAVTEISLFHPTLRDFIIPVVDTKNQEAKSALVVPMTDRSQVFFDGFAFRIEGVRDYLVARDQISSIIADSSDRLETFLQDPKDDLYYARVSNFLTHVIIASAAQPYRRRAGT